MNENLTRKRRRLAIQMAAVASSFLMMFCQQDLQLAKAAGIAVLITSFLAGALTEEYFQIKNNPQNQLNFGKEDGPSRASFGGPG